MKFFCFNAVRMLKMCYLCVTILFPDMIWVTKVTKTQRAGYG